MLSWLGTVVTLSEVPDLPKALWEWMARWGFEGFSSFLEQERYPTAGAAEAPSDLVGFRTPSLL